MEQTVDADKLDKAAKKLKQTADKLNAMQTLDELRGAEGLAAKFYFATFADLLDGKWKWKERTQHPARDPVNALLNYGYAFLEREGRIAVALAGMDARIGFFHANDGRIVFCTRYEEYMAKKYREYGDKTSRDVINERVKKFSAYLNR